jgi:hypothetical protein
MLFPPPVLQSALVQLSEELQAIVRFVGAGGLSRSPCCPCGSGAMSSDERVEWLYC